MAWRGEARTALSANPIRKAAPADTGRTSGCAQHAAMATQLGSIEALITQPAGHPTSEVGGFAPMRAVIDPAGPREVKRRIARRLG